jgi:hypothetical protein
MKIRASVLAVLIFLILFGGIAVSKQLGWWITVSQKVPAAVKTGEYAGQADPLDIRGSFYFTDIQKSFNIPLEALASAFRLSDSQAASFQCKNLESIDFGNPDLEIGTASVRTFVAFYIGWSPDQFELADLPPEAVRVLLAQGKLSDNARQYLSK